MAYMENHETGQNVLQKAEVTNSYNKATGELIGTTPVNDPGELKSIIEKARKAQKVWADSGISTRADIIKKIAPYIDENCDEIAKIISQDNGKTRSDALLAEILSSAMASTYYSKKAKKFLKTRFIKPGSLLLANKISRISRVPFGVIGIISPWNYPFSIPFSEVVMGLLAGNAVILKTATETQMVGKALKDLFDSIGLPENIFNYVNMPGRVAGDAFLESGVDKLFFTGSVPVGKYLMSKAGETLTPVSLELGGNDAMIVCEDADLERAAEGAIWGGFQNTGQSCGGVERIYVEEPAYDEFINILNRKTSSLRVGLDTDFNVDIGVMTTSRQVDTVKKHLDDALEKGAKISSKAKVVDESLKNVAVPIVLTGVNHEMIVMKEETFGPLLGVMKVGSIDEALKLANDSNLGLTGSVWSKNTKNALKIADKIDAGAITINDHLMSHGLPETPWGGFKESGIGRTHGELGFDEMTEPKVIINDIMPLLKRNMWWYPNDKRVYDGLKGMLGFLYGKGIKRKAGGLYHLLKLAVRSFVR